MNLDYLLLAIIAMTFLGIHFFLVKLISRHVAGPTIAFFAQFIIIPTLYIYICSTNTTFLPEENIYLWFTLLVSLLSAIGIITLYMAIQRGPISVVIPIFSLNAVITAILGILILEEAVTVEKITGLVLAIAAIILLTRD